MDIFQNLCRLCIRHSNSSICLNHIDVDKIKFIDKLKFVFNDVILEEDNGTPFQICSTCCKKLKVTYDFKKQCTTSYEYWQVYFHKMNFINKGKLNDIKKEEIEPVSTPSPLRKRGRPKKVKTENSEEALVDDLESILKPNITESRQSIKLDSILKPNNVEHKFDSVLKSNIDEPYLKSSLKNKLNILFKPEEVIKEVQSTKNVNTLPLLNLNSLKSKLGDALKIGIQNIEKEKQKIVSKKSNKKYFVFNKMVYIIDSNKTFYCTSCNKYFGNLKSLKIHIIQDLGIKNIPCKLCKRRFFSRREKKIHMRKHTLRT